MKVYIIGIIVGLTLMTVHYQLTKGKLKKKRRLTKRERSENAGFEWFSPW